MKLDLMVKMGSPRHDWLVLDIATGGGHTALKFAPLVKQVIATDITQKMLQHARDFISDKGLNNVLFKSVDGESLPFKDRTFDLVTCRLALHHFPYPTHFFNESMRVLKNGKLLLVLDQLHPDNLEAAKYIDRIEKLRDPSHNRAYNQTEWTDMFQLAGLVVEQIEIVEKKHELIQEKKHE